MGLEFLAFIVILLGIALSFTLKGNAARRARKGYAIGLALLLGGCFGTLSWLDAETSGQANFAVSIHPFIWAGLFVAGVIVMFANSLQVLRARVEQKRAAASALDMPDPEANEKRRDDDDASREF